MLVLSRKKNERIFIRDDIIVTVLKIWTDKVRIGIEAPRDVPIHREEVYKALHGKEGQPEAPTVVANPPP